MRKKLSTISNFIYQECGTRIPLPRVHGQQREHGDIKDIWCPTCKPEKQSRA